jgi:hypothetical protein
MSSGTNEYESRCSTCMWWHYAKNSKCGACGRFDNKPVAWNDRSCSHWVDYVIMKIPKEKQHGR